MARELWVDLGEHCSAFVDSQVERGRYGSASEVVRAGLRLLEQREQEVERIRAALIKGQQSGYSEYFNFDEFHERMRRKNQD